MLISLLNVPICIQGMQPTCWPEAGTIIVTGPYYPYPEVKGRSSEQWSYNIRQWHCTDNVCDYLCNLYEDINSITWMAAVATTRMKTAKQDSDSHINCTLSRYSIGQRWIPAKGLLMKIADVFSVVCLDKKINQRSNDLKRHDDRWFETPWHSRGVTVVMHDKCALWCHKMVVK